MTALAVDLMHLAAVVSVVMVVVGLAGLFVGLYRLSMRQRTQGARLALYVLGES